MAKRHNDAIAIQMGACNPSGILHSMLQACEEIRAEPDFAGTASLTDDPALRLMLHQLAWIMGAGLIEFNNPDWYDLYNTQCARSLLAAKNREATTA